MNKNYTKIDIICIHKFEYKNYIEIDIILFMLKYHEHNVITFFHYIYHHAQTSHRPRTNN